MKVILEGSFEVLFISCESVEERIVVGILVDVEFRVIDGMIIDY